LVHSPVAPLQTKALHGLGCGSHWAGQILSGTQTPFVHLPAGPEQQQQHINSKGQYIKSKGQYINSKGQYINSKGQYINSKGQYINSKGLGCQGFQQAEPNSSLMCSSRDFECKPAAYVVSGRP
jgi:hypothetical protein